MIGDDEPDLWRMSLTDLMTRQLLRLGHRRLVGTEYQVTTNHKQWRKVWLLRPTYPVRTYRYGLAWRLWRFWFRTVRRMTFHRYLIQTRDVMGG